MNDQERIDDLLDAAHAPGLTAEMEVELRALCERTGQDMETLLDAVYSD